MFSIENSAFAWLALNLCIFFVIHSNLLAENRVAFAILPEQCLRATITLDVAFSLSPRYLIDVLPKLYVGQRDRENSIVSLREIKSFPASLGLQSSRSYFMVQAKAVKKKSCLIEFYLVIRGEHNTHRSLATAAAAEWTKNCVIRARTTHTTPAVSCTLTIRKAIFILYSILATAFCIFCFSSHRTSCTYFVVVVVSFLHFAHTRTRLLCIWKYAIPNTYYMETYTFTMQWQRACACDRTQLNLGHCLRRCRRRLTSSSALRLLYCWNALFNITAMHILYVFHTVLFGMSQYSVWVYETCSSWHTNLGHHSIFQTTNKIYIYCRRKNGIFGGL